MSNRSPDVDPSVTPIGEEPAENPVQQSSEAAPGGERPTERLAQLGSGTSPERAAPADGDPANGQPQPGDHAEHHRVVPRDPWRRLVPVTLLLAIVAFGFSLLSVHNAPRLSALDEATHIDYAYQLSMGHLARGGEPLAPYTINAWACRGQANIPKMPACDSNPKYASFPGNGLQYNAFHPPLYYAVTGVTARAVAHFTGVEFITAARSLGALWLLAGMLALYLTLRYWRVNWGWALGGALMLPLFPSVLHASSIVTNDAPAMLCGVAALYLLGRAVVYRNYGWVLPAVFAVLVTATKTVSAIGLVAVAFALVILAVSKWRSDRPTALRLIRNSAIIGAGIAVVQLGWQAIQNAREVTGYKNPIAGVNTNKIIGAPFDEWVPNLLDGVRLASNFYLDPKVDSAYLHGWVDLLTWLVAAAGLVALAIFRRGTPRWLAGATLVLGTVTFPLIVQLQTSTSGAYFAVISDRYGMTLIPLAVCVLVLIAADRKLRKASWLVMVLGGAAVLTATLGLQ